jgi:hypothetical protein
LKTHEDLMTKSQAPLQSSVSFEGTVLAGSDLLRSPVSGQPCVHWRLRIVERLTPRTQLVHELASSEPFQLAWAGAPGATDPHAGGGAVRIRLEPEAARIHATPVLHREGTPGALAAARAFGFAGPISVEEVVIRNGEAVSAEGILDDSGRNEGPFRSTSRGLELHEATVRLDSSSLGPAVLLPWALGTAAALLSGMGLATYAAWRHHLANVQAGSHAYVPRAFAPQPARLEGPELPHPRLP